MPLSTAEGRRAVELARETLDSHVKRKRSGPAEALPRVFAEKRGVFVTLNTLRGATRSLRGCIGYSEPIKPLAQAIKEVAVYASEDPRFPHPVLPEELDHLIVEVSVLTVPTELRAAKRSQLPAMIRLGVDGIIISNETTSGLFLPQVATEQGWDQEAYIAEACGKAGLPPDAWLDDGTRVETFQAEVFGETSPRGEVKRMEQGSTG
ncbi:MAG: TIGR00296 family protein [Nitrososphaerota archaeon]|nr:TIGR00296 family protein [Nitrososphaerota archaeon]